MAENNYEKGCSLKKRRRCCFQKPVLQYGYWWVCTTLPQPWITIFFGDIELHIFLRAFSDKDTVFRIAGGGDNRQHSRTTKKRGEKRPKVSGFSVARENGF